MRSCDKKEKFRGNRRRPIESAHILDAFGEPVLDVLRKRGYRTLDVQCGNSDFDASHLRRDADDHWQRAGDLETSIWRFKPSLKEDYERADLIISHAGT